MDLYPPELMVGCYQWNAWEENFAGRTESERNIGSPIETRVQVKALAKNWGS